MTDVLLVTCAAWPDGEPEGHLLLEDLAARGLSARWVAWDDPHVEWRGARIVAVRSVWDYESRQAEFLRWAGSVGPTLLNGPEVFAWNTDKAYLLSLIDAGLPVVPTLLADDEGELAPALATFARSVVKPRVGASGRGVVVFDGEPGGHPALDEAQLEPGPWVVQPLVESVRSEGETSVFVLGGRPVGQVRKRPAPGGEIRVHELYGGQSVAVPLTEEAADLARRTVEVAAGLLGRALPYARVDLVRGADGSLLLIELEVTEPGLYLDVLPEMATAFGDLVEELLGDERPE
jgi:glutathione synthase/RimK-type ligase-like ATP-grasp enzyme